MTQLKSELFIRKQRIFTKNLSTALELRLLGYQIQRLNLTQTLGMKLGMNRKAN